MKNLISCCIVILSFCNCNAQQKVTLTYIGQRYIGTHNRNFVNNELLFLRASDTVRLNVKIPFNADKAEIINQGIYYNCHLKEGEVYSITLKKACTDSLPDVPYSYYKINAIPDDKDCSKFTEIKKDTPYKYMGNYGKYVDMGGILYEIIGFTPNDDCFIH